MRWLCLWQLVLLLSSIPRALAATTVSNVNGQLFAGGLLIVNSPQPGTTIQAGQNFQVSMDVAGSGLLPQPNPGLATTLLQVEIFLVSDSMNVTLSEGKGLLEQESGSTVKHFNAVLPGCLPAGSYDLTFYELSFINSVPFFSISLLPVTISRSSDLPAASTSCGGATTPRSRPQADSASPVAPLLGGGKAAFSLSTGVRLAVAAQTTSSANGVETSRTNEVTSRANVAKTSSAEKASTPPVVAAPATTAASTSSTLKNTAPFGAGVDPSPTARRTSGFVTVTSAVTRTSFSAAVTVVTSGTFPQIITTSFPNLVSSSVVLAVPTGSDGKPNGVASTVNAGGFGVFGVDVISGAERSRGGGGALLLGLAGTWACFL